jgi:hypothetical protein
LNTVSQRGPLLAIASFGLHDAKEFRMFGSLARGVERGQQELGLIVKPVPAKARGIFHLFLHQGIQSLRVAALGFVGQNPDLPPTSRTKLKLVKSVNHQENDGHEEEQIHRGTDHRLPQAG